MLEAAVYSRLAGFAGLATLVGDRIFPVVAPDDAIAPYVVYVPQAPVDQVPDLNGAGDLGTTRVQVDVWAVTADDAIAAGTQARLALNDFTGTVAGVDIKDVTIDGGFDDAEAPTPSDGSAVTWFRRSTDFLITTGL